MKKIRINVKSAPEEEQLKSRIESGFRHVEIQLLHSRVLEKEYEITTKMIKSKEIDISVVHTPLIKEEKGMLEISLNHILQDSYYEMLCDTIKYAEYIANIKEKRIKVVLHEDFSEEIWFETNLLNEKVGPKLKAILDKNPHVDLVIENAPTVGNDSFRAVSYMSDIAYSTSVLNKIIPGRIFTLIDTCHMMMTIDSWKRVTSGEVLTNWEEQFKQANEKIPQKMMHLNNMHDNGLGTDHGVAFESNNEKDLKKLDEIMKAYTKYTDCEITIEVREDSYITPPYNVIETVKSLEKLGYELDKQ